MYVTRGSGGNGVNTVYFIDTTGTALPHRRGASRFPGPLCQPSRSAYARPRSRPTGPCPTNMCILQGFTTHTG